MSDASQPVPVKNLSGQVTRGNYGAGSKSEREAIFIQTAEGRYVLRRKGGPVFADDTLDEYVGHSVACDGFVVGTTLLAERIRKVD